MKLSEYVIDFLGRRGVSHVFGISGGAAVHLFDAAARHEHLTPIFAQHEQASAISADGYARATGRLGVAITTSGPGATNLLTGTACSYYDSVPTMMITGQVATHRLKQGRPIRQLGFQETDILSIFGSVTKYAVQIGDPNSIRYHLEKAFYLAFEGRPGSVLLDIPDDLQRSPVIHDGMAGFEPEIAPPPLTAEAPVFGALIDLLGAAERPVLVLGGGLATPRLDDKALALVERLGIPVLQTWAALDLVPGEHPLRVGSFGVYGPRLGNFVVQNADLLLCLGTRLSQNVTGGILPAFARQAKIVMVDASAGEMDKFDGRGIDIALRINVRAEEFVSAFQQRLNERPPLTIEAWHATIGHWRETLPTDRPTPAPDDAGHVDACAFVDELSAVLPADETIFVDTGGTLTWTCNCLVLKRGQKLLSAWNNTPMGYALPAAIGGALGVGGKGVTCVIGDGGLMLCLGELTALLRHRLPIKILLFNNHGHGIQKQTLETWLDGYYVGVDEPSGLSFADFNALGAALGLPTMSISRSSDIGRQLRALYAMAGPVLCNVEIRPDQKLVPFLKFGAALEEQQPQLNPALLQAEMMVPRYDADAATPAPRASIGV